MVLAVASSSYVPLSSLEMSTGVSGEPMDRHLALGHLLSAVSPSLLEAAAILPPTFL
jgi:hypothetical protein